MMNVNTLVEHVRFYSEDKSYENKDPYDTILTVLWLDSTTISLQGLRGSFNTKRRLELITHYKSLGVTTAYFERNGQSITLDVR